MDATARFDPQARRFLQAFASIIGLSGLSTIAGCSTSPVQQYDEGFEYRAAPRPQPITTTNGRLEVAEIFWYGCPHCNAMEPVINRWVARLPRDVVFRKVHAGLAPGWVAHQRMFYALESLGRAGALDARVFDAIHGQGASLGTVAEMVAFVAEAGLDRDAFVAAFESTAVLEAMARADAFARAMGVQGVPAIAVNGRWLTSPGMAGSYAAALAVADVLLERERAAGVAGRGM
jgi:thiol:disulfide interchange protein DsbA